jgi:hypothetical protein
MIQVVISPESAPPADWPPDSPSSSEPPQPAIASRPTRALAASQPFPFISYLLVPIRWMG